MTDREAVEAQIPRLALNDYRITSPRDNKYNCFAYAAGDTTRIWSARDPRHAARQLPNGRWTSKLGDHVDIEHAALDAVGGDFYGEPAVFMRKPTKLPPGTEGDRRRARRARKAPT